MSRYSDFVDNWDGLPPRVQEALLPCVARFEEAADLLFDRRLNLSFEAAVKDLSVPGVVALTEGLRLLRGVLARVSIADTASGALLFDEALPLTAYDLPLYAPPLYLSQLAQFMDGQNVRVWKAETAVEIEAILLIMARFVRPDIETARVLIAALHDMAYLYPGVGAQTEAAAGQEDWSNAARIAGQARRLSGKR